MKERAVRLVYEQQKKSDRSQWAIICSVASKIGCSPETLRHWIRKDEIYNGKREGLNSTEREHLKQLEKENRELKKNQRNHSIGFGFFREGGARPPTAVTVEFIDQHCQDQGVETMCETLQIDPSTYYDYKVKQNFPDRLSDREQSDALYRVEIRRVWDSNFPVYGARKVWHQLRREGFTVARCTVERLMRSMRSNRRYGLGILAAD